MSDALTLEKERRRMVALAPKNVEGYIDVRALLANEKFVQLGGGGDDKPIPTTRSGVASTAGTTPSNGQTNYSENASNRIPPPTPGNVAMGVRASSYASPGGESPMPPTSPTKAGRGQAPPPCRAASQP